MSPLCMRLLRSTGAILRDAGFLSLLRCATRAVTMGVPLLDSISFVQFTWSSLYGSPDPSFCPELSEP